MNSRIIIILLSAGLILSGCKVLDSNKMFETPDDYPFTEISTSDSIKEFKFEVNDEFSFSLFSNNGF